MSMQDLPLCRFTAGTFIELDDPMTGERFIAQVCDSGTEFIDTTGETGPRLPLPIFAALNPVEVGDFRTLKHEVLENRPEEYAAFAGFVTDLFDALPKFNDLTFMRAVKWAFDGGDYKGNGGTARALEFAAQLEEQAKVRQAAIAARADLLAA